MLVLPNRLLYWVLSTSDQGFVSFQPILCHPRTQIEIILFHDEQRDIPNLETFSQPCFNWIFSNCLSHNSPAKGWPYRFRSRGTTGSSILDHDFGHVCRGRRTQMSGHSDFEIFNNFGSILHFFWVWTDSASAACPAQPSNLEMISFWLLLFEMLKILVQWILPKIQNHLSQYHLELQLGLCIFGALPPISIFQMTYVHQRCKMNFCTRRPCFINHIFFASDFCQVPTPKFSPIFPIPCPLLPLLREFSNLEA